MEMNPRMAEGAVEAQEQQGGREEQGVRAPRVGMAETGAAAARAAWVVPEGRAG